MNAVAPALTGRPRRWRLMLAFAGLALLPWLAAAQSVIQITPIPEQKHATVTPLGAADFTTGDITPWMDAQMAQTMQQAPIAGAVVMVVKDGNIVLSKGYGYADIAAKRPVDPATTLFRAGPLSQLFLWTAVMQLVEQHKLDLDVDINHYLDFQIPPFEDKPLTLRDLMTHTAGFENVIKGQLSSDATSVLSNEAWVKRWVPARIYAPGSVPAYSTYGAALAGYIVQRVSGLPFDEYAEKHIFQPLALQHASFRQPVPAAMQSDLALGYLSPDGAPRAFEYMAAAPAEGLSISGEDMARFMIAYLQYGRVGEAQLLQQSTVQLMQRYRHAAVPGLPGMALGFVRFERNGLEMLGQAGDTATFHSALVLFPEQHAGLFITFDGAANHDVLRPLVSAFADRYFPPLPQLRPPTLASGALHGAQVAGPYQSSRVSRSNFLVLRQFATETQVRIANDGTLRTPMLDAVVGPAHWREVKPYLWLDDASGSHLSAVVKDGKVRMLATDALLSAPLVYLPVPAWESTARLSPIWHGLLAVLVLVTLAWPAAALIRRMRKSAAVAEVDLRWYRLSHLAAVFYLLSAVGWWSLLPHLAKGTPSLDVRVRLLQLIGVLAVLGTVPVAMYVWQAWRVRGNVWQKVESVILLLACLASAWFVFQFHLLSPGLNY